MLLGHVMQFAELDRDAAISHFQQQACALLQRCSFAQAVLTGTASHEAQHFPFDRASAHLTSAKVVTMVYQKNKSGRCDLSGGRKFPFENTFDAHVNKRASGHTSRPRARREPARPLVSISHSILSLHPWS